MHAATWFTIAITITENSTGPPLVHLRIHRLCNSLANDSSDFFCSCLVCYLTGPQIGLIRVVSRSPFKWWNGECVSVCRARMPWCMLPNLLATLLWCDLRCGWRFPIPLCRVVSIVSVRRKMSLWISKLIRKRNWFVSEQTNQINCKSSFSSADCCRFRYSVCIRYSGNAELYFVYSANDISQFNRMWIGGPEQLTQFTFYSVRPCHALPSRTLVRVQFCFLLKFVAEWAFVSLFSTFATRYSH